MANIILPERFSKKLAKNQNLLGAVNLTLSTFGEILKSNKLYFFEEYTDHGIEHIQNVIKAADTLITDDTFDKVLNPEDVGYFILSVILHDLGMHISLDGLNMLLNGSFDHVRIHDLDKLTWKEQWDDFLNEAKKYSGKQLKSIFGDENAFIRIPPIDNPGEINSNDRKLIGEFIRKYHPRLAHEIGINGFPGDGKVVEFAKDLSKDLINITGLIARSHGLDLRKCNDYIEVKYGRGARRVPKGIHATFLMVLLRIADYIQIDASRTSTVVLKTKRFSSPVSSKEHEAHLSIDNVDFRFHDDPERIFVQASPTDSIMFLKLKKLFNDIQYEFDISWAVLGELYGTMTEKPEIKYRRISSNIEDENFVKQQEYIADSFSFKANDEVTKLLIAPLYGDDPKYGVRELLQNSIDACKERQKIEKTEANPNYQPFVKISIDKVGEDHYFTITDNGIGMNLDVLKNYFLSAGASYRRSLDWQKDFTDINGKSLVRRSGRFGVGILAAFLIGEKIEVTTKSYKSDIGYSFDTNLEKQQINIVKNSNCEVGTKISIKISSKALNDIMHKYDDEYLDDDEYFDDDSVPDWFLWYKLNSPKVEYWINSRLIKGISMDSPDANDIIPEDWNYFDSDGFDKILWTYKLEVIEVGSRYSCNGIKINDDSQLDVQLIKRSPYLSIFDSNASLPLTLNRNSFSSRLPFENDLIVDIFKDIIACLLTKSNVTQPFDEVVIIGTNHISHPSLIPRRRYNDYETKELLYGDIYSDIYSVETFINKILCSQNGYILNYPYFIEHANVIKLISMWSNFDESDQIEINIQDSFFINSAREVYKNFEFRNAIEAYNTGYRYWANVYLKTDKYAHLFNPNNNIVNRNLKQLCIPTNHGNNWTQLSLYGPTESIISSSFLEKYSKSISLIRENEMSNGIYKNEIFDGLLSHYLGDDVLIPYDIDKRREKFPKAFSELERYMKKYINKA